MNTLGFDKPPHATKVVVAMSGGVDSSVTAAMLHEQGYEVIGITLQLYDQGMALGKKGACCAGQDIYDAKRVSEMLGIPHYVLDYENSFSDQVIQDFADSYLKGETPIPCVRCNQRVKFKDLLQTARELGADCLATGHYVQRLTDAKGQATLNRAHDLQKDQSYFLFATTQEQLDYLRFPLGGFTKPQTRALAEKYGLIVADKPDSQDICFVPNGSYASVVQKLRPDAAIPGDIVHLDGRVLGHHQGIIHYTIGQRKGLGIGGQKGGDTDPLYVIKLNPELHQVIVGPYEALACQTVPIKDVNWLIDLEMDHEVEIDVKLRSVQAPAKAILRKTGPTQALVTLTSPQYGISAGQACVFYQDTRVLGGGWISF